MVLAAPSNPWAGTTILSTEFCGLENPASGWSLLVPFACPRGRMRHRRRRLLVNERCKPIDGAVVEQVGNLERRASLLSDIVRKAAQQQ